MPIQTYIHTYAYRYTYTIECHNFEYLYTLIFDQISKSDFSWDSFMHVICWMITNIFLNIFYRMEKLPLFSLVSLWPHFMVIFKIVAILLCYIRSVKFCNRVNTYFRSFFPIEWRSSCYLWPVLNLNRWPLTHFKGYNFIKVIFARNKWREIV